MTEIKDSKRFKRIRIELSEGVKLWLFIIALFLSLPVITIGLGVVMYMFGFRF